MLNVFAVMLLALCGLAQAAEPLQKDLPLAYVAQADSDSKDRPLIIFLHGYGGDENDLMSFTGVLPSSYNYLSARAPRETGQGGYQWFAQRQDSARYDGVTADLKSSRLLLEQFIEQATRKYHTQASKVYLVGFSQGAMMSYELALRDPQLVAGFAALSGHMLPVLQAELKPDPARQKLAVFIGHGSLDKLIPLKGAIDAQAYLQAQGITPQFHAYFGLPHGVNEAEVRDLKAWLAQVIKAD